jgi:Na+/H+-dicarboxylate symporter
MKKSRFKINLLGRVAIAIVLGVGLGLCLPHCVVRVFATFNAVFAQFLGFLVPLIIAGLVTSAIASIGKSAGKLLLVTVLLAYGNTVFSGLLSYGTSVAVFPHLVDPVAASHLTADGVQINPYFTISIPPMFDVMTALVFAFAMGLGIAFSGSPTLRRVFDEFADIVMRVISVALVPLLPLYILGMFMIMAAMGEAWHMIKVFMSIIVVVFAMHIGLLLLQYVLAGMVARRNPLRALRTMLPAYLTALGTSSSAATIPVTLKQTRLNGVDEGVSGFVVPLCATIHLSGSAMKITACAVALMLMHGSMPTVGVMVGFVMMLGVMMVAAPGVPGGAIMAALGVLQTMLGFDESMQALMIALYIAMDSFGTACNVTGDGAIAMVVNTLAHRHKG